MGLFRRSAKGRHAFGAAVTSIPSAPPSVAPTPALQLCAEVPQAPEETDVGSSIAALIATGEAWRSEAEIVAELRAPAVAPAEAPPAEASVAAVMPPPPPSGPRVQLGFRDGTSAMLAADSDQALALELLAQSLTRRD